jgi:hypothetical protein
MSYDVDEVVTDIIRVLQQANPGKSKPPRAGFLTAYQILDKLRDDLRRALIEAHGPSGKGAGEHHSAAKHLAISLIRRVNTIETGAIEKVGLDTSGLHFKVSDNYDDEDDEDDEVAAGYGLCTLYRLRPDSELWKGRHSARG